MAWSEYSVDRILRKYPVIEPGSAEACTTYCPSPDEIERMKTEILAERVEGYEPPTEITATVKVRRLREKDLKLIARHIKAHPWKSCETIASELDQDIHDVHEMYGKTLTWLEQRTLPRIMAPMWTRKVLIPAAAREIGVSYQSLKRIAEKWRCIYKTKVDNRWYYCVRMEECNA